MESRPKEHWGDGTAYERYVGRWSRLVAREFLDWLAVPQANRWLDVGCGTGTLVGTIVQAAAPSRVTGLDRSLGFAAFARDKILAEQFDVAAGDAQSLPFAAGTYDAVVSGLMLNFVPEPKRAAAEMVRVAKSGGTVGVYIWDYADKMEFLRHFWDAAIALDDAVRDLDEGPRFPICHPQPLADLFRSVGLRDVQVRSIDIATRFHSFDDYWSPFLGGQGPAPTYLMSLNQERRVALRETLRAHLPVSPDGSIALTARAWAARGTR